MQIWRRLCVDIDRAGNPIGWSVEHHQGEEAVRITCGTPEPFDSVHEALETALGAAEVQPPLFL